VTWPHGDPSAIVKAVLAERPYRAAPHVVAAKVHATLLGLVWDWLRDHVLRPIFGPLRRVLSASHGPASVLGVVLICAALCALAYVVFRLVVAFAGPARSAMERAGDARELAGERSPAGWRALAREAAARSDYARAIAALFAAALAALDASNLVEVDPARTPGEYRRIVRRARAAAAAPFDDLADRFVRAAYAEGPPARVDFEAAERALAALEPELRS
jgi:hypothetical protein